MDITYEDAHHLAKDEILQQSWDERERHAKHGQQQVADREVQQEDICHRAHALVLHQGDDDQQVAEDREEKDDAVQGDADLTPYWAPSAPHRVRHVVEGVRAEMRVVHGGIHAYGRRKVKF